MVVTALSLAVAAFASTIAWRVVRDERRRSDARVHRLAVEIGGDTVEPVGSESSLAAAFPFGTAAGVGAVILAAIVAAVSAFAPDSGLPVESAPQSAEAPSLRVSPSVELPLELVALGHDRSRTAFTVRGIVRNPADGASRGTVTAFVQLFDDLGGLVTSGTAPVASVALLPGEERTFVVVVSDAARVERYRVSFRTGDNVIPHVDRRADATPSAGDSPT
jgi:hypothetical protein